jgi:mycothiol synthase
MPVYKPRDLVKKSLLTTSELAEIEQLVAVVNRHDKLHMRFYPELAKLARGTEQINNYLFYQDNRLAGYLSFWSLSVEKREMLIGTVHPAYRRQGIFRALFEEARREYKQQGVRQLIFTCESNARAATACAGALNARYVVAEHAMRLEQFQERYVFDDRLTFEEVGSTEIDKLVAVQARSFDDSEARVLLTVTKLLQDPDQHFFLARWGEADLGCREPVGVMRIHDAEDEVSIHAFGVLPDYRQRGYGRQMLEEAIRSIRARSQKPIVLEVDTTNAAAIHLYESCGFRIYTTHNYYVVEV